MLNLNSIVDIATLLTCVLPHCIARNPPVYITSFLACVITKASVVMIKYVYYVYMYRGGPSAGNFLGIVHGYSFVHI